MTMPILSNPTAPVCSPKQRAARSADEAEDRTAFERVLRKKEEEERAEEAGCAQVNPPQTVETEPAGPAIEQAVVEPVGPRANQQISAPAILNPAGSPAQPPVEMEPETQPDPNMPPTETNGLSALTEQQAIQPLVDGVEPQAVALPDVKIDPAPPQATQPSPAAAPPALGASQPAEEAVTTQTAETEGLAPPAKAIKSVELEGLADPQASFESTTASYTQSVERNPYTNPTLGVEPASKLDAAHKPGEIDGQVAQAIAQMEQASRGTLRLQLRPAELGAIDIRLVSRLDGLRVTMLAENPQTGRMLEAQIDQLRQTLANAGIALNQVQIQQQAQHGQTPWHSPQHTQTTATQPNSPRAAAAEEPKSAAPGRTTAGGVDYRI